ncbi:MAG: gamma-glutamylcyclotransferase [Xanthomonadales bacterium]|nr:gamma-glutamylcyclotransferase [Xanthomonadales bacterium]NIN58903.1 gamma-glutamylcyclotransferase [Xanthomonadales bacterium]NIN74172.1 gamma-glutamylcyclotransferase [Xanthomonadales bacterium]NIO13843.1 gamma-glutamylcyclotransferase [Xanthomonadales bacterium]NIP11296.1 gamma-glutamylcyclotransferase [Xanthomonadales bacterium]
MIHYLAYGSNLHPRRLAERAASARLVATMELPGYRLVFAKRGQDGSAKCTLAQAAGHHAHVAVYRMAARELPGLDAAEGLGAGYEHGEIAVRLQGVTIRSLTYLAMASHYDERLRPFHWYKALVLCGARYHGFPPAYLEALAGVPSIDDPDAHRADRHGALLGRLVRWPHPG